MKKNKVILGLGAVAVTLLLVGCGNTSKNNSKDNAKVTETTYEKQENKLKTLKVNKEKLDVQWQVDYDIAPQDNLGTSTMNLSIQSTLPVTAGYQIDLVALQQGRDKTTGMYSTSSTKGDNKPLVLKFEDLEKGKYKLTITPAIGVMASLKAHQIMGKDGKNITGTTVYETVVEVK